MLARKAKLDSIYLTVLGSDAQARAFYDALKYVECYSTDDEANYEGAEKPTKTFAIMRKQFNPPADVGPKTLFDL